MRFSCKTWIFRLWEFFCDQKNPQFFLLHSSRKRAMNFKLGSVHKLRNFSKNLKSNKIRNLWTLSNTEKWLKFQLIELRNTHSTIIAVYYQHFQIYFSTSARIHAVLTSQLLRGRLRHHGYCRRRFCVWIGKL
jgi:hypothetical protein